ncbi:MAG: esterase family protein [Fimbriimonadaceae bacterium]|nr:esterase family protein [Fimbriimonadaceae bacterium]
MALIHCDFFSETLGLCSSMYVILPQPTSGQIGLTGVAGGERHKVLWLLHGMSDDHTIWLRRTSIERYVAPLGLAVVMPAVARSYYTDMAQGGRYWTYLAEELPAICQSFFPLSTRREDNYAAGLSMGGYGAFKLALRQPERFCAAASLSGALDVCAWTDQVVGERSAEMRRIFGDRPSLAGSDDDLFHLAAQVAAQPQPPRLFQWCGSDDFLYQHNLKFRDHCAQIGLPLTSEEGPGGHTWDLWDAQIQRVLQWFELA